MECVISDRINDIEVAFIELLTRSEVFILSDLRIRNYILLIFRKSSLEMKICVSASPIRLGLVVYETRRVRLYFSQSAATSVSLPTAERPMTQYIFFIA